MPARPRKSRRFGGDADHQKLLFANLAASLFAAEAIVTTEAKAKALRPIADKLITKAKTGTLHARRNAGKEIHKRAAADKLFQELGPTFATRKGGYTRIIKTGHRKGDGADMARIELVEGQANAN